MWRTIYNKWYKTCFISRYVSQTQNTMLSFFLNSYFSFFIPILFFKFRSVIWVCLSVLLCTLWITLILGREMRNTVSKFILISFLKTSVTDSINQQRQVNPMEVGWHVATKIWSVVFRLSTSTFSSATKTSASLWLMRVAVLTIIFLIDVSVGLGLAAN